jgi:hypothetical protein
MSRSPATTVSPSRTRIFSHAAVGVLDHLAVAVDLDLAVGDDSAS